MKILINFQQNDEILQLTHVKFATIAKRNWTIIKRRDNVVPHSPSQFSDHMRRIVKYVLVPPNPPKVRGLFRKKMMKLC